MQRARFGRRRLGERWRLPKKNRERVREILLKQQEQVFAGKFFLLDGFREFLFSLFQVGLCFAFLPRVVQVDSGPGGEQVVPSEVAHVEFPVRAGGRFFREFRRFHVKKEFEAEVVQARLQFFVFGEDWFRGLVEKGAFFE